MRAPRRQAGFTAIAATALLLGTNTPAVASAIVLSQVTAVGGGYFQYDLQIDNTTGTEALLGLVVLNPGNLFGLSDTSIISAPQDVGGDPDADWFFIAPTPPGVNLLSFFSPIASADVPIGGVLGGFSFLSLTDPGSLSPGDFAVEGIGSDCFCEIPLGDATITPEPASMMLLGSGISAIVLLRRRARARS